MRMRTYTYSIISASGEIDRTRIPLFDPFEVARRLPHSLVFLRVPPTHSVSTANAGMVTGPCWTLVAHDEHYLVDGEPQTDAQGWTTGRLSDLLPLVREGLTIDAARTLLRWDAQVSCGIVAVAERIGALPPVTHWRG